jgi:hypothetical protein
MIVTIYNARYPNATTEEALQGYRGDVFRGKAKDKSFVERAIGSATLPSLKCAKIILLEVDILEELDHGFIQQNVADFNGADLVFLDIPKVGKCMIVLKINCMQLSSFRFP